MIGIWVLGEPEPVSPVGQFGLVVSGAVPRPCASVFRSGVCCSHEAPPSTQYSRDSCVCVLWLVAVRGSLGEPRQQSERVCVLCVWVLARWLRRFVSPKPMGWTVASPRRTWTAYMATENRPPRRVGTHASSPRLVNVLVGPKRGRIVQAPMVLDHETCLGDRTEPDGALFAAVCFR